MEQRRGFPTIKMRRLTHQRLIIQVPQTTAKAAGKKVSTRPIIIHVKGPAHPGVTTEGVGRFALITNWCRQFGDHNVAFRNGVTVDGGW